MYLIVSLMCFVFIIVLLKMRNDPITVLDVAIVAFLSFYPVVNVILVSAIVTVGFTDAIMIVSKNKFRASYFVGKGVDWMQSVRLF